MSVKIGSSKLLTKEEQAKLKKVLQEGTWDIIEKVMLHLQKNSQTQKIKRDSEFETLWTAARREGMIDGFFLVKKRLEKEAYE